jgi:hypothetical protein
LLKLHLLLASTLSAGDWDLIDRITNEVLRLADDVRVRHCRKFMQLHKNQHPTGPPDTNRTVINLSGVPLEEAACSAMSKGLNYAVAPGRIPAKDFLCGVEKAIATLRRKSNSRRSGSSKALASPRTTESTLGRRAVPWTSG